MQQRHKAMASIHPFNSRATEIDRGCARAHISAMPCKHHLRMKRREAGLPMTGLDFAAVK